MVIFVTMVLLASILACSSSVEVAQAISIDTIWGEEDLSELWYYQEDYLNTQGIKDVVSTWDLSNVSEPIVIGVIDTGISASHSIFNGVLLKDENGNTLGYNVADGSSSVSDADDNKHGTQVASVMAMLIRELGLESYIKILPIKAGAKNSSGDWIFTLATITSALDFVSEQSVKIDVVNMSLGLMKSDMSSPDWSTDKGLQYSINMAAQSAVVVSAAGNYLKDSASDAYYPAVLDGVVSVMGYGEDGQLYTSSSSTYPGSNYGSSYDLIAPAQNILVANGSSNTYNKTFSGTSAAAPFVSVAAALLKLQQVAKGGSVPNANSLARMLTNVDSSFVEYGSYSLRKMDIVSLLTQDWIATDYNYKNPVEIVVSYPTDYTGDENTADVYMLANKITPLTLTAQLRPYGETDPSFDDTIEWFVQDASGNEKVIGIGTSITYAPSVGGEYLVGARFKYDQSTYEDTFAWHVDFLPYIPSEVRVTYEEQMHQDESEVAKEGVVYTDEIKTFSLTGLTYLDTSEDIVWYVNGEEAGRGTTFKFSAKEEGVYIITAKYGNENVLPDEQGFRVEVKHFLLRPLDLSMLVIGLSVVVATVVTLSVLASKNKKRKEESK